MKYLIVFFAFFLIKDYSFAQKKVKLYFQLNGEIEISGPVTIFGQQPPTSKKKKIQSIDSLINYEEINELIEAMDYKGVRILSELGMKGWKLESVFPVPEVKGAVFARPRVFFLLSKEFEIPE